MKKFYLSAKFVSLLLPFSLLISGCDRDDLDRAENFGLMVVDFRHNTSTLSQDIFISCMRRTNYYSIENRINGRSLKADAIEGCLTANQASAQNAKVASNILADYIEAIGQLASENTVSFNASLENISQSLNGLTKKDGTPLFNSEQVNAGIEIVGFWLDLNKQDFQRNELKKIIPCTNDSVQTYIQGLKNVFQEVYINETLTQEQQQMLTYYQNLAVNLRNEGAGASVIREVDREYATEFNTFLDRRNQALSYLAFLDKTAKAHANLTKVFAPEDQLSSTAFQQQCDRYFAEDSQSKTHIKSDLDAGSISLTEQEWQQVQEILTQYYQEVTPLLEPTASTSSH